MFQRCLDSRFRGNDGEGGWGEGVAAHAPKTKWRPASLPASTVPRSVGLAREGETAFPREVPAEALRPRSVPQVPSQEYRYSGSGPCGFRAQPEGRLRFPGGIRSSPSCDIDNRFPIGLRRSEASSASFRETFRPGASGFAGPSKESGFGFGLRRRLALLPSGCPGPSLRLASVRRLPPLSAGPSLGASLRFRKVAPCDKPVSDTDSRFAQALSGRFSLWITGITGITQVKSRPSGGWDPGG